MPPKKKQETSRKSQEKAKERIIEVSMPFGNILGNCRDF